MQDAVMDRDVFTHLYTEMAPVLHAWAGLRIPAAMRRHVQPEDVVQEVWWRAMDGLGRFDPSKGNFRAWIFRVALHVLLEALRRHRPRNRLRADQREAVASLPASLVAEATSISLRASRSEKAVQIMAALSTLDEDDRQLLLYCGFEGLSAREVAPLCGIGEEACRKRWQRLRNRLSELSVWDGILE